MCNNYNMINILDSISKCIFKMNVNIWNNIKELCLETKTIENPNDNSSKRKYILNKKLDNPKFKY